MKVVLAALLPILLGAAACAKSEPAYADPDDVEAAVNEANEQATLGKDQKAAQ